MERGLFSEYKYQVIYKVGVGFEVPEKSYRVIGRGQEWSDRGDKRGREESSPPLRGQEDSILLNILTLAIASAISVGRDRASPFSNRNIDPVYNIIPKNPFEMEILPRGTQPN